MSKSTIEWTEHTWNPVTGCTKCSPGCLSGKLVKMPALDGVIHDARPEAFFGKAGA
jgi:protein gp37